MINLQNTDIALKNIYLDVISEHLNSENQFLAAVEHTCNDVWGKYIRKYVRFGDKYVELCLELANLYGTIEISEKAMRASENNTSARVALLNSEIEDLLRKIKTDISRQLFYCGGMSSFSEIFRKDGSIYGLNRTDYPQLVPYIQDDFGQLTEEKLEELIDKFEQRPDFIITSFKIGRFLKSRAAAKTAELNNGSFVDTWNGIRIVSDGNCPKGTMFILSSRDFTMHQLCDWQWLEGEDGAILKKRGNQLIYIATLVKYANLMCNNPSNQAMLTGVTVDKDGKDD